MIRQTRPFAHFFLLLIAVVCVGPQRLHAQQADTTNAQAGPHIYADSATKAAQEQGTDSTAEVPKQYETTFSLSPSLGVTLQNSSTDEDEVLAAQWLAGLQSRYFKDGATFQFGALLYAKYGQSHSQDEPPKKTQDKLILSLTPSVTVIPPLGIRLFLETTGETQFKKGMVDTIETNFLDPLVLYQMLFLGKRLSYSSEDGQTNFDLTTGVGYALQQTLAQQFILSQNRIKISENSPLASVQDNVTFESGYCAMIDVNYDKTILGGLNFKTGLKTVALTKTSFADDIRNARVTSLFQLGLTYKSFGIDYSNNITYDRNISMRRALEQSLVFGFKATIH